jgi:hypothetical protein
MQPRQFWLDTQTRQFISSPDLPQAEVSAAYFREDVEGIELYFVRRTGNLSAPFESVDYSGAAIKLAIGLTQPAALITSFSALSGAVSITSSVAIAGGNGVAAVQNVSISPQAATGSYSLRLPARNVTVSSVTSSVFSAPYHGLADGQAVTLTAFTISSGFTNGQTVFIRDSGRDSFRIAPAEGAAALTVQLTSGGGTAEVADADTEPLPAGAPPAAVQQALRTASRNNGITVSGTANSYSVFFGGRSAGTNFPLVTAPLNTLAVRPGFSGQLNLNTTGISGLVAAGNTNVTLEIEVADGALRHTYQRAARLASDIITSTSPLPTPVGDTVSTLNFDDGEGGVWVVSIDADGVLTTTKA